MIVCLFGPTLSGKTSVARIVAAELDIPLRSCGDAVRIRSRGLGLSLDEVPDSIHAEVDRETILWAEDHKLCLAEGRFLDAVFAGHGGVVAIRLTAANETRIERGRSRVAGYSRDELLESDAHGRIFRTRVYAGRTSIEPSVIIDTTKLNLNECAACVMSIITKERVGRT